MFSGNYQLRILGCKCRKYKNNSAIILKIKNWLIYRSTIYVHENFKQIS